MTRSTLILFVLLCSWASTVAQRPPARVVTSTVERARGAESRRFIGSVRPVRSVVLGSPVAEMVVEYMAEAGRPVKAGQPLARLRTTRLEIRLQEAQGELARRKAVLAELEAGSRPEEIAEGKALVAAAKAEEAYREWLLEQTRLRVARGAAPEEDQHLAAFNAASAHAARLQNEAKLALLVEGPRKEVVEQARREVQIQESVIRGLTDDLERHVIRAPFDGYVTEEHTEEGAWLSVGAPLATLAAVEVMEVVAPVPEDQVHLAGEGTTATVTFEALPGRTFDGQVFAVNPAGDPLARTFDVMIRLDNPVVGDRPTILAGMTSRIAFRGADDTKGFVVPKDALVLGGPAKMVYVVDTAKNRSVVRAVPVEVTSAIGNRVLVRGALRIGQDVVVEGNERLRPGQAVQVIASRKNDGAPNPSEGR